ncbi:Sucraseferredoxin-like protein [Moelleriella libera RCEF 2490]|uniref:Sucraseferredoxin-like protein n=1 Tax=Moelleriella libera RCEF 2490 TaxID=1081109 RepID=A0A167YHN9_9HYPO|nr:Sucraseferredoxin-like protein [Moelleriella libera RCEF 2490]
MGRPRNMAVSFKSLVSSVLGPRKAPASSELFDKPDGDDCLQDCESCTVRYPRSFKIDEDDTLYGHVKGWSTHVLVGTGKSDWVRDVADEKGSVMQAISKADAPTNGKLMLSASDLPTPHDTHDYNEPTTVLLLPAFTLVEHVHPRNVPTLISEIVSKAPTNDSPLAEVSLPPSLPSIGQAAPALTTRACPHNAVILMCSQRTRDARCGQSAPLLKKEFERHLRPLGLYRDMHDERPGGVGIYFISHVGGHKYSANVMVYRRPNAFGQDDKSATETQGTDVGAAQCIWLARVKPQDCENLVKYTVLKGQVVKPENQLRGGFDRVKGLTSW